MTVVSAMQISERVPSLIVNSTTLSLRRLIAAPVLAPEVWRTWRLGVKSIEGHEMFSFMRRDLIMPA